jgi:glutaconate CoA-transferase subunit B
MGITTEGPVLIVTDLCMMRPDADSKEFEVVSLHPGVSREDVRAQTGWDVRFAGTLEESLPPNAVELEALRELNARTARAHATRTSSNRRSEARP